MSTLFDLALASSLLGLALYVGWARDDQGSVVGFIALGLLLSLAWTRLQPIDVALTEAAIGSGVTGLLLLRAQTGLGKDKPAAQDFGGPAKVAIGIFCAGIATATAYVVLTPPDLAPTLAPQALGAIDATGLGNPVTAVLMAYRAIDTLLEKVVLILALVGVWSLTSNALWGGAPATPAIGAPDPLVFLGRSLPPIGVLIAVYLLWVGADAPGGAFQGGAVLAAMWLLAMFSGLRPIPQTQSITVRLLLVAGPLIFLAIGFLGVGWGAFLAYPDGFAKPLIVIIEVALILSIAVTLGMLVAGPSKRGPER
jgi:multisubunit Na+/H+ antiporter MnhB subunit